MSSFPGSADELVYKARVDDSLIEADVRRVLDRADKAFTAANTFTRKSLGSSVPNELKDDQVERIVRQATERQYRMAEQAAARATRQAESNATRFQRSSDVAAFTQFKQDERATATAQTVGIQKEADQLYAEAQRARSSVEGTNRAMQGTAESLRQFHRTLYVIAGVANTISAVASTIGAVRANMSGTPQQAAKAVEEAQGDVKSIPIVGEAAHRLGGHIYTFLSSVKNQRAYGRFESDQEYKARIEEDQEERQKQFKKMQEEAAARRQTSRMVEDYAIRSRRSSLEASAETAQEHHAVRIAQVGWGLEDFEKHLSEQPGTLTPAQQRELAEARASVAAQKAAIEGQFTRASTARGQQGLYGLRALEARNAGDDRAARQIEFTAGLQREREAARAESPGALAQFDREGKAARTKEFEDRERRDKEKADTESALRVSDSVAHVEEIASRRRGEDYAADVNAYARAWDDKLAKARLAVTQETDLEEKGRRQRELSALEREREADVGAYAEKRKRREVDETAQHEARVREYALRAAGQSYRADEDAFEAVWQHKLDTAENDAKRLEVIEERDAARSARRADQARKAHDVLFGASETALRSAGRGGIADILQIRHDADKAFAEAAGNPQLQQSIRFKEAADLRALDRRLADRGTFESVGGPNRVDFRARLTGTKDPQRDTADVLRDVIAKLLSQIEKNTKGPLPGVTT